MGSLAILVPFFDCSIQNPDIKSQFSIRPKTSVVSVEIYRSHESMEQKFMWSIWCHNTCTQDGVIFYSRSLSILTLSLVKVKIKIKSKNFTKDSSK